MPLARSLSGAAASHSAKRAASKSPPPVDTRGKTKNDSESGPMDSFVSHTGEAFFGIQFCSRWKKWPLA